VLRESIDNSHKPWLLNVDVSSLRQHQSHGYLLSYATGRRPLPCLDVAHEIVVGARRLPALHGILVPGNSSILVKQSPVVLRHGIIAVQFDVVIGLIPKHLADAPQQQLCGVSAANPSTRYTWLAHIGKTEADQRNQGRSPGMTFRSHS
jgi:hypothetical protein